jgi:TraX protein
MNAFQIKIIAIIAMIIDHMGLFFFPQYFIFRIIGRLAFPLFCWLIANGAHHTKDIRKYLLRLYFFALASQVPYLLANRLIDQHFSGLNVLCTLFFGLMAIVFIQRTRNWVHWFFITVVFGAMAQLLQTDYGGFGVAVIVLFYVFYYNFKKLVIAQLVLFFVPFILFPVYLSGLFEPIGLLSLVFIRLYNNKPGPRAKYLFYIFYPLQYIIYYLLLLGLLAMPI